MLPGWTRIDIGGKPADVYEPPTGAKHAVLFLHPHGGESPAENARYTAAFAKYQLAVAAPHGVQAWWADKICVEFDSAMTAEHHLLHAVVPWMRSRWPGVARNVAAAGISMGGQGAVRLGFKFPHVFPVVASVAGAFDYHDGYDTDPTLQAMYPTREACRQDTAILHFDGRDYPPHIWFVCDPADDEWYRGNDRLHEKLAAHGVPHAADLDTAAGGHSWEYFDAFAGGMCAFIVAGLAQSTVRLM